MNIPEVHRKFKQLVDGIKSNVVESVQECIKESIDRQVDQQFGALFGLFLSEAMVRPVLQNANQNAVYPPFMGFSIAPDGSYTFGGPPAAQMTPSNSSSSDQCSPTSQSSPRDNRSNPGTVNKQALLPNVTMFDQRRRMSSSTTTNRTDPLRPQGSVPNARSTVASSSSPIDSQSPSTPKRPRTSLQNESQFLSPNAIHLKDEPVESISPITVEPKLANSKSSKSKSSKSKTKSSKKSKKRSRSSTSTTFQSPPPEPLPEVKVEPLSESTIGRYRATTSVNLEQPTTSTNQVINLDDEDDNDCDCPECSTINITDDEESEDEVTILEPPRKTLFDELAQAPCPAQSAAPPTAHPSKRHLLGGNGTKAYKVIRRNCYFPDCPLWFTTQRGLHEHLKEKHSSLPLRCLFGSCEESFNDRGHFSDHHREKHLNEPAVCRVCGSKLKDRQVLYQHTFHMHYKGIFACQGFETETDGDGNPRPCSFTAISRQLAINHYNNVHQKLVCPIVGCGKVCHREGYLIEHLLKAHDQPMPWQCRWQGCTHQTAQEAALIKHIRLEHFHLPASVRDQKARGIYDNRNPKVYVGYVPPTVPIPRND